MNDREKMSYSSSLEALSLDFEALCKRCGACCGAYDDPCRNLIRSRDGKNWECRSYLNRFGPQKTVSGAEFNCVSIREHISRGTLRPGCGYHRKGIQGFKST